TLVGSLLDAASHNRARHHEPLALFESGRVYLREGAAEAGGSLAGVFVGERPAPAFEPERLGALRVAGAAAAAADADAFFDLKAVLEALAGGLGAGLALEPASEPFLHPGRSARILVGGAAAGWIGELHPLVARAWDLDAGVAFELGLAELVAAATAGDERYEDLMTHPAVFQDLAVVVAEDVPAAAVEGAVHSGGGELLRSAAVFDVYRGEQLERGRKSLALRLEFRAADRTLTEAEVSELRAAIAAELEKLGGSLRE
ncbi:MAG: phenylalanyl-tRNA synthetase beta chain, partial [Solirubrobacterales bacterium]|nr:phenylalanyl-tRNA synthetase beta chain [Solirubrobacterales bacterium]